MPMSGVFRPYTLVDVLGTLNQGNTDTAQGASDTPDGIGEFAESDESATVSDSFTTTATTPATWDNATWGTAVWS
jgi:hypothetical protein